MQSVLEYIRKQWPETTRIHTESEGTLIGLPYPYTVPCARDAFQEMYYWDTYFTCRGLALQGETEQVLNNCRNFIHLLETRGFIPNGNRTYYLDHSQPPFFGALLDLCIRLRPGDRRLLSQGVAALEKEMDFWKHHRRDRCGLEHYGSDAGTERKLEFYACAVKRLGYPADGDEATRLAAAREGLPEAESGWDFNPRFERSCPDFAPVDLNSLLWANRRLLAELHRELGDLDRADEWDSSADTRAQLINRYCWSDSQGAFLDYNFRTRRHSPVFSAASLYPLWTGLATPEQALSTLRNAERLLECRHGLACCEKYDSGHNYQWDYPNGWAPLQLIAIESFDRYGFRDAALRLAEKYVDLVSANFHRTGDLWEKYNVVDGSIEAKSEYETPRMMGWTAGVFVYAADYLEKNRRQRENSAGEVERKPNP